jgi:peptidoglycan/LPS O-acetylase OafA/YrhL
MSTTSPLPSSTPPAVRRGIIGDRPTLGDSAVGRTNQPGYRPDIDGLRALAVLAVIAFHARSDLLPGGFVGVDVFFVISGYLITSLILRPLRVGAFSIADFYRRRIRRLYPSLTVVLAATIAAGWLLLLPSDYVRLGEAAAAGAGFVANFYFWKTTTHYFSGPSSTLIHLWSLGIEEQFYLVWPLLLTVALRLRRPLIVLLGVALASFGFSAYWSFGRPDMAFYSPIARMWELAAGSVLAYIGPFGVGESGSADEQHPRGVTVSVGVPWREIATWVSAAGILMIACAFVLVTSQSVFPGFWSLLPVLGTAFVIAAGPRAWPNRVLLSHRAMVAVGLMSYPLYLWHWPAIAVTRMRFPDLGWIARLAVLLCAVLASWATYRYVELPIRRRRGRRVLLALCGAQLSLLAAGLVILRHNGVSGRGDERHRQLFALDQHLFAESYESYRYGRCLLEFERVDPVFAPECARSSAGHERVLLWGDSFAAHFAPGALATHDSRVDVLQLTSVACAPVLAGAPETTDRCNRFSRFVLRWIKNNHPETVIVAARWAMYSPNTYLQVAASVSALRAAGVRRVVLVGSSATFLGGLPRRILREMDSHALPKFLRIDRSAELRSIDRTLIAVALRSGAQFVSPLDAQCPADRCVAVLSTAPLALLAMDEDGHLTPEGSEFVVRAILRPYLAPIGVADSQAQNPRPRVP